MVARGRVGVVPSGTRLALGVKAAFDFTIVGPFGASLSPSYIHALGTAPTPSVISLLGGFTFAF